MNSCLDFDKTRASTYFFIAKFILGSFSNLKLKPIIFIKTYIKNKLKLALLFLVISISFQNCEKDDDLKVLESSQNQEKSPFKISKIGKAEIEGNKLLGSKLNKLILEVNKNRINAQNKTVYSSEHDFYINTDYATYLESEDATYHSYTFNILRIAEIDGIENLVFSLNPDSSYDAHIVTYNVSSVERELIFDGLYVDLTDKMSSVAIENNFNMSDVFSKADGDPICISTDWQPGYECPYVQHTVTDFLNDDGSICVWVEAGNTLYAGSYVSSIVPCVNGFSGDDGATNTNSNTSNGTTYGQTSNTDNNTVHTSTTGPCRGPDCPEDLCLAAVEISTLAANLGLTPEVTSCLEDENNCESASALVDFVNHNPANTDISILAAQAICDGECAILPKLNSNLNSTYTGDIGDEPDTITQLDHEAIQLQFQTFLDNNDNNGAVNYLISTYNMETFANVDVIGNFTFHIVDGSEPEAITNSTFSNDTFESSFIEINNGLLTYSDFGWVTRAIKHELFHVLQAKYYPFGATTNNEREFEAYWYSIYRFPKLKKGNDSSETRWAYRVRDFYYDMTDSQKALVSDKWERFLEDYQEICND